MLDFGSYTVTPDKAAAFLQERVVGRAKKRPGRQKKVGEEDEGDTPSDTVGQATVSLYIAALVKLWEDQRLAGTNCHPNPRAGPIQHISETMRRDHNAKQRREYVDRGKSDV